MRNKEKDDTLFIFNEHTSDGPYKAQWEAGVQWFNYEQLYTAQTELKHILSIITLLPHS